MKKFFCKKVNVLLWHLVMMTVLFMAAIVSAVVTKQEQDEQIKQLQQERDSAVDGHWVDMQEKMREAGR